MDFNDTVEEAAFRAEVRAWLAANAKPKEVSLSRESDTTPDYVKEAKALQAKKAAAGFARITWSKDFGGRGGTPIQHIIYAQEELSFDVSTIFDIGLGMVIPTVMKHAKPEIAAKYVKRALYGEDVWCQLFSEPVAGSDLAGIRTKAEKRGDEWVINGQKVWTTGAQISDYGIIVTRTNPDVPKHKGLTMFIIDMKAKGVEVRPIRQISGQAEFNEVFFTDVIIKDDHRIGEVGEGWVCSLTTLMNERLSVGTIELNPGIAELMNLARSVDINGKPALQNGAIRAKIAEWYVQSEGLRYGRYRTITALSRGQLPGPEASIGKVVMGKQMQDLSTLAMEMMSESGAMVSDIPQAGAFQNQWMWSPGLRIAGGTDEILKNIIAERVLGLPPDIRVDKDVTFRELEAMRG